jgi:hypothetical protein
VKFYAKTKEAMFFEEQAILKDFEIILDFIERSEKLELSTTKEWLGSKELLKLHEKLHFQSKYLPERAKQDHFGVLNSLLEIAKTARLFEVDARKSKKILRPNPQRIQMYREMSKAEQYFALLESWWCFLNWKEVYDARSFYAHYTFEPLLKSNVGATITINDRKLRPTGKMYVVQENFILEFFEAMGIFKLSWDPKLKSRPKEVYSCPYASINLHSAEGLLFLKTLFEDRNQAKWGEQDSTMTQEMMEKMGYGIEDPEELEAGNSDDEFPIFHCFASAFKRAFPGLTVEKSLYPIHLPYQPGLYHLRVSLYDFCTFEIAVSDQVNLHQLHHIIQKLVKFDDDHMYAFFPNGKESYSHGNYYSSHAEETGEGKPSHLFCLGQLGLFVGQKILYLFDYGDNWKFQIDVLAIDPEAKPKKDYELLKSTGKPPKQYGNWG